MIPALSEFGFVIECASFNFNLPGREIPLEVCIVFLGIPEAPLHKRMDLERFGLVGKVFNLHQLNFSMGLIRNKAGNFSPAFVLFTQEPGIPQSMPAFILIQLGFGRLPGWRPQSFSIPDVEILTVGIQGDVVITVPGNAAQAGITVKAVASRSIRNDCKEITVPQVVDPRVRSLRGCNHILPVLIIKITKFHIV